MAAVRNEGDATLRQKPLRDDAVGLGIDDHQFVGTHRRVLLNGSHACLERDKVGVGQQNDAGAVVAHGAINGRSADMPKFIQASDPL